MQAGLGMDGKCIPVSFLPPQVGELNMHGWREQILAISFSAPFPLGQVPTSFYVANILQPCSYPATLPFALQGSHSWGEVSSGDSPLS